MKTVKFKKWIIIAIVSFIMTFIFAIIAVVSGGTSMLHGMGNMTARNVAISTQLPDFIENFVSDCNQITYIDDGNGNTSVETDCDWNSGMMNGNRMMNGDSEDILQAELKTYFAGQTITTLADLNSILDQISIYATTNNYTSHRYLKEIADESADLADDLIELNPLSDDAKNDEDQVDFFERTELNNQDLDNYIYLYLQDSL